MIGKKYFWLGLSFGLIMIFLVPPLQSPDEDGHFFRAQSISEGHYWCRRSQLQVSQRAYNFERFMEVDRIRIHPEEKFDWQRLSTYRDIGNSDSVSITSVLCPMNSFTHFPIAASLFVSRLLGASILQSFYLGRITNLLIALLLMSLAIRMAPAGKLILLTLGLLPMTIQQFGSLSYDAVLIPLFWIFSIWTVRMASSPEISILNKVTWIVLALPLIVAKQAYFPMLLLGPLIWDRKKMIDLRSWLPILIGLLFIATVVLTQSKIFGGVSILSITKPGLEAKISMAKNMPWVVPAIVLNTLSSPTRDWELFIQMLGKLGYTDYYLDGWVYAVAVVMLVLGVIGSGDLLVLPSRARVGIWATAALTVFSIFTYMYFIDTPLSRKVLVVRGVQGRYFLPLMYWVLLTLSNQIGGQKAVVISRLMKLCWVLLVFGTIQAILNRYY